MAVARSVLKLYNYLGRKKEIFKPLRSKRAGLYTCGPTVYNYAHIGNFRTYIFEDVLRRTLEYSGHKVNHVMNITDVDDKTIRGSKKARKTLKEFTDFYAKEFFKDVKKLNILRAEKYPRATLHIKEMVGLIRMLLKKKLAYRTEDGVYFDISKFKPYGKLSRLNKKGLRAGTRVAADEYEKNEARDFALWKTKKPGEPSWPSPFGRGRPGWHIECSAMSMKYLGASFDIHAGGVDLIFPHHEDEIAQSEGATGRPFVKYFVEGEHLLVDGKKMSKSLGNVYTIGDVEEKGFAPLDFRHFVLGAHYRTQLNFTWQALEAAHRARAGIINSLERLKRGHRDGDSKNEKTAAQFTARAEKLFQEALDDDLNTPKALAVLNELIHYGNSLLDKRRLSVGAARIITATVLKFDRVLGLNLKSAKAASVPKEIMALVERREVLRKEKKWAEADRLRQELKKRGFIIEDTPGGPIIKRQ
ncbi:MAG: cysteine--tRNA ligase [Candidatus Sungiibacteriota bacterium]